MPFGIVGEEYCKRSGVLASDEECFAKVKDYEDEVLSKRQS